MTKKEYLKAVNKCLNTLLENSGHCFGVDFMALNNAMIETSNQLKELEAADEPDAHSN